MTSRLDRLLRPQSIAVIGGHFAEGVARQCDQIGFTGDIWPIHPTRDIVAGRKAYRSVDDLPAVPDAAFVGVNRNTTIGAMAALSEKGVGGAVAYAAGYAEVGAADLQDELVEAAGDMPFFGPNCYGFINYLDGALLWPDQHGGARQDRGVALITQSGNIGINVTMQQRGLPLAYLLTLGNQASVGLSEAITALAGDHRVTAIGIHLEGIDDPVRFAAAVSRAQQTGIPVVVLKAGRTEQAAALTISHTASLASNDGLVDAYFAKIDVARVSTIPVLLETLKLLHLFGPLPGAEIASMSCSGGEAALIADASATRRTTFRQLTPAQRDRVAATLPELVAVSNPLDYHTFTWGNEPALTETFAAMMEAAFDVTALILDYPRTDRCDPVDWAATVDALLAAQQRTGQRAAVVASLPELLPEAVALRLGDAGVAALYGLEDALDAISAAATCSLRSIDQDYQAQIMPSGQTLAQTSAGASLSEWESKALLAAHGLPVPAGRIVESAADAVEAARQVGFPVVAKATGAGLAHKSEQGAVRLDLTTDQAVQEAASDLLNVANQVIIETMIVDAVAELIVGVVRDRQFGLYLVLGSGGILVELINDAEIVLMPASRNDIETAIGKLKVAPMIDGFRGAPAGDLAAAIDSVIAIQDFALAQSDRLIELDVNPLIIRSAGRGAVAADAMIVMTES